MDEAPQCKLRASPSNKLRAAERGSSKPKRDQQHLLWKSYRSLIRFTLKKLADFVLKAKCYWK